MFLCCSATIAIAGILHLMLVPNVIRFSTPIGIFFLVVGIAQLFWTIPTMRRWSRNWHYIGIAGTIVLIILFFITRVPNPITGGRALPIIPIGIATEVFEFIYVGIIAFILSKHGRMTAKTKAAIKIIGVKVIIMMMTDGVIVYDKAIVVNYKFLELTEPFR